MDTKNLKELGLTDSESKIYSSILKLGTCTVKNISKECGFHRTNIYDILEQLKEKGLVSYFKEGKTTKYKASDPRNLYAYLEEKKELLDSIFPEIEKLHSQSSEEIQVEVHKGAEGMKNVFRDILKEGKEGKPFYAFGVKGQFREQIPVYAKQWMRDAKRINLKYYGIYTDRKKALDWGEIRFVSPELSSPVATFIYGDKININIWEPSMVAITIKSKLVAQMYKQHFDLLWKIAKE